MNKHKIMQHLRLPIPVLLKLVWKRIFGKYLNKRLENNDVTSDLRIKDFKIDINSISNFEDLDVSNIDTKIAHVLIENYCSKKFNLLGSGWKKNTISSFKMSEHILESHIEKSQEIWNEILKSNEKYEAIDWQRDFKVDKSYSAQVWYKAQRNVFNYSDIDIKVPWELSRMQHLPQLAIFAKMFPEKKDKLLLEFKCQCLDFIAMNPYNMGANWNCAMDVGIRSANLLIAFDWFKQLDSTQILDDYFTRNFKNYIYIHGIHLTQNFEYKEGVTSNHYLGNIAGLSFISLYLEGTNELDEWLLLSIQEFSKEMPKQFLFDGTNFEGSTAYHRLSSEFFVISTAFLTTIPEKRKNRLSKISKMKEVNGPKLDLNSSNFDLDTDLIFSESYYFSFEKMRLFTLAYTKPNSNITQIGDNDSGRFFKFSPNGELITNKLAFSKYENLNLFSRLKSENDFFYDENDINHETLVSLFDGLYTKDSNHSQKFSFEFSLIKNIIKKTVDIKEMKNIRKLNITEDVNTNLSNHKTKTLEFDDVNLLENLDFEYFQDFGFLVFKSKDLYLSIRCNKGIELNRLDGHFHNDLLSIELNVKGKDIFLDPGSYVYTSFPLERNNFRKTASHNSILISGVEQRDFSDKKNSLFYLEGKTKMKMHKLETNHFIASVFYKDVSHRREIIIKENQIIIKDDCNKEFQQIFSSSLYSNGYGKLLNPEYV